MINSLTTRFCLAALLSLSCLFTMSNAAQAEPKFLDRIVAIVNDDIIMLSELQRRVEVVSQQLRSRGTVLPDQNTLREQVLDKMITDKLQLSIAQNNGIRITEEALNNTLERVAKSNGLTLLEFKNQLEAEGQVYRDVREQIRDEMLITRTRQQLVNRRIKISDQEVNNYLASEQGKQGIQQELHLAHIMIPIPSSPSTAQLQKAKQQADSVYSQLQQGANFSDLSAKVSKSPHALEGGDLGWRKESELPAAIRKATEGFEPGQISKPFRLGGAFQIVKMVEKRGGAVRMVQKTKVRHILIKESKIRNAAQAESLIKRLRQRIVNGEDFAALAKEYSDDAGSGSLGGELGWALPGQMVPSFNDMMDATQIGELSPAFKSRFGWHILEVEDRQQEDLGDRIIANEARESIRKRKFNEELINWISEIRSQAYIEIKL